MTCSSRAFEAAGQGDWAAARSLGAQGQNPTGPAAAGMALCPGQEQRRHLRRDRRGDEDTDARRRDLAAARHPAGARRSRRSRRTCRPPPVVAWFGATHAQFQHRQDPAGRSAGRHRRKDARRGPDPRTAGPKAASIPPPNWPSCRRTAPYLTPESDRARLDNLLWRGEITAAKRQMARVDAATADIAKARIALMCGLPKARSRAGQGRRTVQRSRPAVRLGRGRCAWPTATTKPMPCCCACLPAPLAQRPCRALVGRSECPGPRRPGRRRSARGAGAGAACRPHRGRPVCRAAVPGRLHRPALSEGPGHGAGPFQQAGGRRRAAHQQIARAILAGPRL